MSDLETQKKSAAHDTSVDSEPAREDPTVLRVFPASRPTAAPSVVSFDRRELGEILRLYGRKVAEGEWRDYALDFTPNCAVFSIFRRTSEVPLYKVVKDPRLARRQGAYAVVTGAGMVLRRGHELARVVSVLDRRIKLVSS